MSKRLPLILVIVAILFVILTMTFAQDVPFHVEVLAQSARMRWGPGPTYVIQHYANAGHVLLVLDVDADSDPPWTWYYARTPSGAQSWIRSDLVRRRDDGTVPVEQRVSNPTGNYPVRDDNFCNTNLFRPCQEGADHQLWEAGYWASNRYNHWESGGWDLNTVYYLNPCREDRVCPRREDWDSGRLEAEILAVTITPDATLTPFGIEVTVVSEIVVDVDTFENLADGAGFFGGTVADQLYTPPRGLYPGGPVTDNRTRWGEFRLNSESISVDCYYWHNAYGEENVKSGRFGVNLGRLLQRTDDNRPNAEDIAASNVNCGSESTVEPSIFARQWKITISRSYSGRSQIGGIHWRLEATYGLEPNGETPGACTGCITDMTAATTLYDYIRAPLPTPEPNMARTPRQNFPSAFPAADNCMLTRTTSGESPRQITRYEHTCETTSGTLRHKLTFHYTRDETRGFAPQPTAIP